MRFFILLPFFVIAACTRLTGSTTVDKEFNINVNSADGECNIDFKASGTDSGESQSDTVKGPQL